MERELLARLDAAFAASGAAAWGGVPFSTLTPYMPPDNRAKALTLCPGAAWVLTAAYPYYPGHRPGNLSLYARGEDYHLVLIRRLTPICNLLSDYYNGYQFLPASDNSPLPEREAAWRAGLGLRGRHGLLILPPWGSYVFLATVLTDAALDLPAARSAPNCMGCGACLAACPARALTGGGLRAEDCLSHLTQKKGELSPAQAALVAAHPLIWGCDICQQVCPYNREVPITLLPEFRDGLIDALAPEDLAGMTNRTFQAAYGGRAFAWRGPAPLRRNLALRQYQLEKRCR